MGTDDLCELAADLASEHGAYAIDYARRAVVSLEDEGDQNRADFWHALSVLVDDILTRRIDPERPIIIH